MKTLSTCKPDETVFVLDLDLNKKEILHLEGVGIFPESLITVVQNDDFHPIVIEVFEQSRFALDRRLAEGIMTSSVLDNSQMAFGGNQTKQREIIFEILKSHDLGHFSLEEFTEKVQEKSTSIGQITVYRALKTLLSKNILEEIDLPNGVKKFELKKSHHDHLICESCGKIYEFHNDDIEAIQEKIAQKYGMKISHHSMVLYGKGCSSCS